AAVARRHPLLRGRCRVVISLKLLRASLIANGRRSLRRLTAKCPAKFDGQGMIKGTCRTNGLRNRPPFQKRALIIFPDSPSKRTAVCEATVALMGCERTRRMST